MITYIAQHEWFGQWDDISKPSQNIDDATQALEDHMRRLGGRYRIEEVTITRKIVRETDR